MSVSPAASAFSFDSPLGTQGIFGVSDLPVNVWWNPDLKLLVDTGYSLDTDWAVDIDPTTIFVTHHHPDHDGGLEAVARVHDSACIIAADPTRVTYLSDCLTAGEVPSLFDGRIDVIFTPGHTRQHYILFDHQENSLYAGDMVLSRGTPVAGPPEGSFAEYMRSLAHIITLAPEIIYPGHGPVCGIKQAQWTYDHRRQRLEDVLEALERGEQTPAQLVERIYLEKEKMVLEGMHRMVAEMTVVGYLEFLIHDGAVIRDEGVYLLSHR